MKILINKINNQTLEFDVQQVPSVGECVLLLGVTFKVTDVLWTFGENGYDAFIKVALY